MVVFEGVDTHTKIHSASMIDAIEAGTAIMFSIRSNI